MFLLTLIGVRGGQDGAVFPLHLLHVFGNLVNKTPDVFHLETQVRGVRGKQSRKSEERWLSTGGWGQLADGPKHGLR